MVIEKIKRAFSGGSSSEDNEYLEIDVGAREESGNKVLVKLFDLKNYDDVNIILNAVREGYTIGVVDIRVLRKKDSIELKRSVAKIKKTVDAIGGNIAGFGENTIIITPAFARIEKHDMPVTDKPSNKFDTY